MKTELRQALDAACDGFSSDRVLADPTLNARFLSECLRLGLTADAKTLNKALLNARKGGGFENRPRPKKTSFPDLGDYRFASEVAVRFLELRHSVSLDDIICDPELVAVFDRIASEISPDYSSLKYRWAALNLRKSRQLRPEIGSRLVSFEEVRLGRLEDVDIAIVPPKHGLYIFYSPTDTLYVGESENLKKRLRKHLDHSDNKGLARWLWANGDTDVHLEVRIFAEPVPTRHRRAIETELIASRQPIFNVRDR